MSSVHFTFTFLNILSKTKKNRYIITNNYTVSSDFMYSISVCVPCGRPVLLVVLIRNLVCLSLLN